MLRKIDERLRVTVKKDVLLDMPMIKVSQIVLYGRITVTAAVVAALMERHIDVCYLTRHGKYLGRLQPEFSKNSLLRREQYRAAFDAERSLPLARQFVLGKLMNMRTWLMRMNRKLDSEKIRQAIRRIKLACNGAQDATGVDQVRGHEGEGSAAYFSVFNHLIRASETPDASDGTHAQSEKQVWQFTKRVRRPPTDPINSLLSFGYTLLANDLFSAVNVVGFDPYVGFLHAERYGRASLPLDLIEEFRPVIVDSVVISAMNNARLTVEDFREEMGGIFRLTDDGRKKFLMLYEDRKKTEFSHPVLKQKTTYQKCFEQQARFLSKTLMGELDDYPPLLIK